MKVKMRIKQFGIFLVIITMGVLLSGCSKEDSKKELVGNFRETITANLEGK